MPVGVLEYLWYRDSDPWWATLLRTVGMLLFVIKAMHKVPSGSMALRTRFGKVVHYRRNIYDRSGYLIHRLGEAKVVGPGLVLAIPFVHNLKAESITEQSEPLKPVIRLHPARELACQINFKVVHLKKALFGVGDYRDLLVNRCAAEVRRLANDPALSDDDISERLLAEESPLQLRGCQLGVKLLEFTVSYCKPIDWKLVEPAQLLDGPDGPPTLTTVDLAPAA
jgi:hypothetical protein